MITLPTFAARPPRLVAWLRQGARSMIGEVHRHPLAFGLVATVWVLALVRLFVHHTPLLPVLFNWTASVPYRVVWIDPRPLPLARGDLVVYAFGGEAAVRDYPGLRRQPFFKRIVGVAGDTVTVEGREVFVNGVHVGRAMTHTFDRRPLDPIAPTVIPAGLLYVQGHSPDSFDSRYRSSGLVRVTDVVARVLPLF